MATLDDVRDIASALPGCELTGETQRSYAVLVKGKSKGLAWEWLERVDPKKGRVPNPEVWAVRTPNLEVKEMLLAADEGRGAIFTEPHYNGYPAVLVRLALMERDELENLLRAIYDHVTAAGRGRASTDPAAAAPGSGSKRSRPRRPAPE